jgi:hypothetical protein
MRRFGLSFDEKNNITMWDNTGECPMNTGGEPMRFEAHEWMEAERVAHVMNQRVEHPELTNANGSLVSVKA